ARRGRAPPLAPPRGAAAGRRRVRRPAGRRRRGAVGPGASGRPHNGRVADSTPADPSPAGSEGAAPAIPNVLAQRYASDELTRIWSAERKIVAERRLWLAVLRAQAELGVEVPPEVFADYERVIGQVDLE